MPVKHYGFAQVPRLILRGRLKDMSLIEKGLYACLKDICGDSGECYYSLRNLGIEIKTSASTLTRYIPKLVKRGVVTAEKKTRGNTNNHEIWHIRIVDVWEENDATYAPQEDTFVSDRNKDAKSVSICNTFVASRNKSVSDRNSPQNVQAQNSKDCFYLSANEDREKEDSGEEEPENNAGDTPSFPLSKKELQKQNEIRASEIWALVETELKTTFSGVQRHTKQNQDGMNGLLESDETNERIIKALKGLDAWQRSHFTLSYFLGLIPGLNSGIIEPPKSNGKYPTNALQPHSKPSIIEASRQGMISDAMVRIALQAQIDGIPYPDENISTQESIPNCPHGLNYSLWFTQYQYRKGYFQDVDRLQAQQLVPTSS